jgi:hypothetical protein
MALRTTNIVRTLVTENAKLEHYKNFVMKAEKDDRRFAANGENFPITHIKEDGEILPKVMPESHLLQIIAHDPTSVVPDGATKLDQVKKIGRFSNWLVLQYFKKIPKDFKGVADSRFLEVRDELFRFIEDLYRVKEDLMKFHRFNQRVPEGKRDIGKVKDTDDLYNAIKDIQVSKEELTMSKAEIKEKIKREDAKYVYEDDKWEIIIPLTPKASWEIAGPPLTRWCTASSEGSNQHHSYSNRGPLFILRDKHDIVASGKGAGEPRPVYQFHFPSNQFMDPSDKQIELIKFLKEHPGMKDFFRPQFEAAFNKKDFNPNDKSWHNYIALYGTNEDTKKMILNVLKSKIESKGDITISDRDDDVKGFFEILDQDMEVSYKTFFDMCLKYAKPDINVFELTFENYTGEGWIIPDEITKFKNLENIVLSGFAKNIPESVCQLENLELISVAQCKSIHELPECIGLIPTLTVLNVTNSPVLQNLPKSLQTREERNMDEVLIVYN